MQRPWLRNDTDTVNHGGTGQPNSLNHGYEQSAHLGAGPYPDRVRPSRNNVHTTDDAGVGERLARREPVHRTVPGPLSRTVQLERVDSPQPGGTTKRPSGISDWPAEPPNEKSNDGRAAQSSRPFLLPGGRCNRPQHATKATSTRVRSLPDKICRRRRHHTAATL